MSLVRGMIWLGLLLVVTACPDKEVKKDGAPPEPWTTERSYTCGSRNLLPSDANPAAGFIHISVPRTCSAEPAVEEYATMDPANSHPIATYPLPGTNGGAGGVTLPYDPKNKLYLNCPGGELNSGCTANLSVHYQMLHTPDLSKGGYTGKTNIPCNSKRQIWRNYSNRTLDYKVEVRSTCGADPVVRLMSTKSPTPVEEFNARTGKPVYGITNGHYVDVFCPGGGNGRQGCDVQINIVGVR